VGLVRNVIDDMTVKTKLLWGVSMSMCAAGALWLKFEPSALAQAPAPPVRANLAPPVTPNPAPPVTPNPAPPIAPNPAPPITPNPALPIESPASTQTPMPP